MAALGEIKTGTVDVQAADGDDVHLKNDRPDTRGVSATVPARELIQLIAAAKGWSVTIDTPQPVPGPGDEPTPQPEPTPEPSPAPTPAPDEPTPTPAPDQPVEPTPEPDQPAPPEPSA